MSTSSACSHVLFFGAVLFALLLQVGCGAGSSNSSGGGVSPSIASVSVSGPAYSEAGFCGVFHATVSGTGSFDGTVRWYVNDVLGGDSATGSIDTNGDYCAPSGPPANNPVSIKAVASADAGKFGSIATRVVAITISPTQAQMYVGDSQQFIATVNGTASNALVWMVNGTPGGSSTVGTISTTGFYTAPVQVTNIGIAVEATPAEAASIYASANINVSGRIVISPPNPQLTYGGSQQFIAKVIGSSETFVNWRATYGFINSSGLYTASATQSPDTISAWTTDASGNTTVQVLGVKPVITSLSRQPATALGQITVNGSNLVAPLTAVFSDSIGGQIPVTATNATGSSASVIVPQGSVTGPFYVLSSQGGLAPVQSNTVQFQRLARLRIHSPLRDLAAGESVTLQYALMGDASPHTVTFSADLGTFSGATYLAPASVTADTFAHITGCIKGTTSCNSLILGLHPFWIGPDLPLVPLGTSLQLSALLGNGTTAASWNLLDGGGAITSDGLYTSGTRLQDGGPTDISAVSGGTSESTSVGVTGVFPGLVNRIYEYADQHDQNFESVASTGMAVIGNRLYVAASNHIGGYTDSYYWIDVYDITDSIHPAWLTAVESYSSDLLLAFGQYLYSWSSVVPLPGYTNGIALYSLQSGIPALKARTGVPQWWNIAWDQGVLTSIVAVNTDGSVNLLKYDLTSGTIATADINLVLPSDANSFIPDTSLAVGNRLFVSVQKNDNQSAYILTYDLSTSPPTFLGAISGRSLRFYSSGNLLFGALGGMDVYDISSQLPQWQSHVNSINAQEIDGNRLLAYTEQQGCQVLDVSNSQNPKVTTILFDGVITGCDEATFVGNYVYASEYGTGIAVYDASQTGGPIVNTLLYGGGAVFWSAVYDMLFQFPYVYAAASTGLGATLNVYDTSTVPATRVGEYFDGSQQGLAIQSAGNYLYFGMSNNTGVLDATQPASPALVASLPIPAISFARIGNTLFAGTLKNSLNILDISNPALPNILSTIPLPDLPSRMRISGNLLLVADNFAGLLVYDISSPHSPVLLSRVQGFALAADVTVKDKTAYVAADVDGLVILDLTNPSQPNLVSKTPLSRIYPFLYDNPMNQALAVAANNELVYVGTLNDNGLVFGLDCANPSTPRIVSVYAYGDFIMTWVGSLLFTGHELFVGGSLGSTYPVAQVDISQPYNTINRYFPPPALQSIPPRGAPRRQPVTKVKLRGQASSQRFPKVAGRRTQ